MPAATILPATLVDAEPQALTVPQFCNRYQLSRSYAYELMSSGKLRSVRIGRCRRIPMAAVLEFEANLTGGDFA